MAKVRYVGAEESVTAFGKTFFRHKPNANHGLKEEYVTRLAHNPQFEVEDYDGPIEPAPGLPEAEFAEPEPIEAED